MVRVMVVEDEKDIGESLQAALTEHGFVVELAQDGTSALAALIRHPPDLILLDLVLPDIDGSTLLTMVRSIGDLSVIALTARSEPEEIVRILNLGADDYITKPFDVDQVIARIGAVLRRSCAEHRHPLPESITTGGLTLIPGKRMVFVEGAVVELRHLEYELLLTLALADGKMVPTDALIRRLWGAELDLTEGASRLDVQLSLLRSKLGESARQPHYLHRVRNRGVRLASSAVR